MENKRNSRKWNHLVFPESLLSPSEQTSHFYKHLHCVLVFYLWSWGYLDKFRACSCYQGLSVAERVEPGMQRMIYILRGGLPRWATTQSLPPLNLGGFIRASPVSCSAVDLLCSLRPPVAPSAFTTLISSSGCLSVVKKMYPTSSLNPKDIHLYHQWSIKAASFTCQGLTTKCLASLFL